MRSFTEVVFDDIVQGSTSRYSEPRFDALLASADAFAVQVVVNQLSAGSPTVTVAIEHGADGRSFAGKSATPRSTVRRSRTSCRGGGQAGIEGLVGTGLLERWVGGEGKYPCDCLDETL